MKKHCFHPPKNIIVGTLAAMLWVAVFPFWLLGESTPLNALVSGEVPLWDALTRLVDTGVGVIFSMFIYFLLRRERLEPWLEKLRGSSGRVQSGES